MHYFMRYFQRYNNNNTHRNGNTIWNDKWLSIEKMAIIQTSNHRNSNKVQTSIALVFVSFFVLFKLLTLFLHTFERLSFLFPLSTSTSSSSLLLSSSSVVVTTVNDAISFDPNVINSIISHHLSDFKIICQLSGQNIPVAAAALFMPPFRLIYCVSCTHFDFVTHSIFPNIIYINGVFVRCTYYFHLNCKSEPIVMFQFVWWYQHIRIYMYIRIQTAYKWQKCQSHIEQTDEKRGLFWSFYS